MPCKHGLKKVGRLPPLPGESEVNYLVPLEYTAPKTPFGRPLFALRNRFFAYIKISRSEIEAIRWKKHKSSWTVDLGKRGSISSFASIDKFIDLKNELYNTAA
ncbi:hypothetical protein HNW13_017495 [Shewanella sp. BF02_Schw]|uniref:hypothetical protein n=1 Tax=Shewanella sp. BF02_Schw TaxID=394908 RepID=UPI001785A390|nr:hypothetical protein [Shewanella sp. BF02_Schw]MBO1897534.1 hypothetical protein [Shewanella sp. BF02_Schw]